MNTSSPLRSALAVNTVLIAAAASAVFLGSYGIMNSAVTTSTPLHTPPSPTPLTSTNISLTAYTDAARGDCLAWDVDTTGHISNFAKVACAQDHRFEVASREDLTAYPTSEFSKGAPMPSLHRQAELREELCQGATLSYLDGKYDPAGRYSIAPILPPAEAWAKGDRTLLCGLQTTNQAGTPLITAGRVTETDQSKIAAPGQCREVDPRQVLRTVDCTAPHQLETVSVVNLREHFPDAFPPAEQQDKFLKDTCTQAAQDYLGGEENLYQSTLQPYWGSLTASSWNGGSYSVNCSLIHANPATKSFSAITGSAKAGRAALTIDGVTPPAPPSRNPLRPSPH